LYPDLFSYELQDNTTGQVLLEAEENAYWTFLASEFSFGDPQGKNI
jgi:hypothetical protein